MSGTAIDMDSLSLTMAGDIAVIELDNPPVNALFGELRDDIAALMAKLDADPAVAVILFVGAGSTFCAGVDLKRTAQRTEPFFFHAALDAMDAVGKPIAAAIHGAALGGGLELALTCHYRLAGPHAKFGLPEVDVGIIPGACGTQRLPRLIPLAKALGVAALCDILDPAAAEALGLIDAITDARDFRAAAIAWAGTLREAPIRRTRDLPVQCPADPEADFAAAAARAADEKPGESAPLKAIAAVRAACELRFDDGVEVERRLVTECKYSPEAKAMRYLFFAERGAGRTDAAPAALTALAIDGSAGDRLAQLTARAGIAIDPEADIGVYAARPGEPVPAGAPVIVFPARRSGVVEVSVPGDAPEAFAAALVGLVRGVGRATVISRGRQIGASLAAAAGGRPSSPDATARLAEEGDRLVASGVARSVAEVDLIAVGCLGFPRPLGGPGYAHRLAGA